MEQIDALLPYSLRRGVIRALRRRCPLCGAPVFRSWMKIRDQCEHCELHMYRNEPDYFFGAWTVGFVAAEFAVFFVGVGVAWWTWPDVPWNAVLVVMLSVGMVLPLITIPFSRVLWLAGDLAFRPPEDRDFTDVQNDQQLIIPPGR